MRPSSSRRSRRKSRQFLNMVKRRLKRCKDPLNKLLTASNIHLEESIIELLRIGAPLKDISALAAINMDRLTEAMEDIKSGAL